MAVVVSCATPASAAVPLLLMWDEAPADQCIVSWRIYRQRPGSTTWQLAQRTTETSVIVWSDPGDCWCVRALNVWGDLSPQSAAVCQ